MFVTIRGKRWKLVMGDPGRGTYGICDSPEVKGKKITIKKNLKGEKLFDTLIHEMLHAACWDMDEYAVAQTAADIARVFKRLGLIK